MSKKPFYIFRQVVFALFIRELKTRFGESRLGYLWIITEPLLHVVMLLLIFSVFQDRMMPQVPFSLFLITGLIPYFLFQHIATALMNSVPANIALFAYKPVKPFSVYVTRTILEVMIYGIIFGMLLLFFWWFDLAPFSIGHPLELFGVLGMIILFAMAVGIGLSVLMHRFSNLKLLVKVGFTLLYFLSGIMYPLWILPGQYLYFLQFNPLLHLIELFRESFFNYYPRVDIVTVSYPLGSVLLIGFIGLWFYHKRESILRSST